MGINPFAYMIATSTTYPAIGALLTIVAVGVLMPSWRSAAVLIVVVDVCWVATAIVIPPEPGLLSMILQMGKADALAAMIVITWGRTRSRLAGANRLVRQLAVVDDLTGLPNRGGLLERGHDLVDHARSTGSMVGVGAAVGDGVESFDQLLARADQAMLADKRSTPPRSGPAARDHTN